jgi:hypothetical protein
VGGNYCPSMSNHSHGKQAGFDLRKLPRWGRPFETGIWMVVMVASTLRRWTHSRVMGLCTVRLWCSCSAAASAMRVSARSTLAKADST